MSVVINGRWDEEDFEEERRQVLARWSTVGTNPTLGLLSLRRRRKLLIYHHDDLTDSGLERRKQKSQIAHKGKSLAW